MKMKLEGRVVYVPKSFSDIHLRCIITTSIINEKYIEGAVYLFADKNFSAVRMINKNVKITHSFEILPV
jgi:uncharacterized OsmC-like protein